MHIMQHPVLSAYMSPSEVTHDDVLSVVVVGASGYAGGELLRLLLGHPMMMVTAAVAHSNAGTDIGDVHPHLRFAYAGNTFQGWSSDVVADADLVFFALPHGESAALIAQVPERVRIVDLGADFRLGDSDAWSRYYGSAHPHAGSWVYGMPDLPGARVAIADQSRVANPGCYATAITTAIAPFAAAGVIDLGAIVAVAASGTSGAGRKGSVELSATEVMNSIHAYKVGGVHQHTPEIEQAVASLTGSAANLSFTPLLVPMPRGIHATVTAPITDDALDSQAAHAIAEEYYADSAFTSVLPMGEQPRTVDVLGTNDAFMQVEVDAHTGRLVATCVIDNLVKGAAGQAIHNANLMFGLDEAAGLAAVAVAP